MLVASSFSDVVLTSALLVALPIYMWWRSRVDVGGPSQERVARYRRSIGIAAVLTTALGIIWWRDRRPLAWLGLAWPDRAGWIGVAIAVALILVLLIVAPRAKQPTDPDQVRAAAAMIPRTAREIRWFVALAVIVGVCWELLYRGYLLAVLAPVLGTASAVLVMALAYAVAHGWHGAKPFVGSLASALLFATGYAVTKSLWWLMIVHVGLPLIALRVRPRIIP